MTEQEIAYLKLRGWVPAADNTVWRSDDGRHMFWRLALSRQMDIDSAEHIDAMLRLPALEAKLSMARAVLLDMDAAECGAGIVGARCIDWDALNAALEVSNG